MLPKGLLKEYSEMLSWVIRVFDMVAMVAAGFFAYFYKFGNLALPKHYSIALATAALLLSIVFSLFRIYESVRTLSLWQYSSKILQGILIVLIILAGLAFLTKTGESFSRAWFFLWAGCTLLLLLLFRCSLLLILRLMRTKGFNERRIVMIGAGQLGQQIAETVQQALWTGFRIVAILTDNSFDQHSIKKSVTESIDEIWIALPLRSEARIKEILHELRHETVTIRLVLDIFGMDLGLLNHSMTHLAGVPMINVRATPMVGINRIIKAIEDRMLAMIILLLISPLFLSLAMLVKITSKGPIFYKQKRMSWNGKEFSMLKFRTMPVDTEAKTGPVWAKAGETRATWIGRFLRKTSLDELPQFINVLRGDMSIVGPRPERPIFVNQFKEQVPHYMQKHLVKAGITGWAQIHGWRGNTSLEKRIEYDLYYIKNWSLLLDIKIIFLTFFHGFINKNAY
ncbi:MAG: wcaJ [Gammaproteobacteria bacterium]|jgi:putative colanic acid biosynthesis UDP-glucose lipid carrier transferase|nr:wcaJ [Gammaproteobacteria bacterium]